jgi:hypothetical protein
MLMKASIPAVYASKMRLPAFGMIARPFRIIVRSAKLQQPDQAIVLVCRRPNDFGNTAFAHPPPHFHLPQTVLRGNESLSKEQVIEILRIDMRYAPFRRGAPALPSSIRAGGFLLRFLQATPLPFVRMTAAAQAD